MTLTRFNPVNPRPALDAVDYTDDHLMQCLVFVARKLHTGTRNLPPATFYCLRAYGVLVRALLVKGYSSIEEREALLGAVRSCGRAITENAFLYSLSTPDKRIPDGLLSRLCDLRRYELAVRYGDYLALSCDLIGRTHTREHKPEFFKQLPGWDQYWTQMKAGISREWHLWRRHGVRDPDVADSAVKTMLGIYLACNQAGLNFDRSLRFICAYSKDDTSICYRSVERLVEQGLWHPLARVLADDLRDLPMIMPYRLRQDIPLMQAVINSVIDEYYRRHRTNPLYYHVWQPKGLRAYLGHELSRQPEKMRQMARAETRRIAKDAAGRHQRVAGCLWGERPCLETPFDELNEVLSHKLAPHKTSLNPRERVTKRKMQRADWEALVKLHKTAYQEMVSWSNEPNTRQSPVNPAFWLELPHAPDDEETHTTYICPPTPFPKPSLPGFFMPDGLRSPGRAESCSEGSPLVVAESGAASNVSVPPDLAPAGEEEAYAPADPNLRVPNALSPSYDRRPAKRDTSRLGESSSAVPGPCAVSNGPLRAPPGLASPGFRNYPPGLTPTRFRNCSPDPVPAVDDGKACAPSNPTHGTSNHLFPPSGQQSTERDTSGLGELSSAGMGSRATSTVSVTSGLAPGNSGSSGLARAGFWNYGTPGLAPAGFKGHGLRATCPLADPDVQNLWTSHGIL